jgi:hypothetical protein
VEVFRQQVFSQRDRLEEALSQLSAQQQQTTDNFVSRADLAELQKTLSADVSGCHDKINSNHQELLEYSTPKADFQKTSPNVMTVSQPLTKTCQLQENL